MAQRKSETKPVMVRVTPETLDAFNTLKEQYGARITKSEIFARLVAYVSELEADAQEEVLFGTGLGLIGRLIDITAGWQEADHAFQLKRWVRAVEAHEALLETAQRVPRMKNFLEYRLGYIWIDIAYSRRRQALRLFDSTQATPRGSLGYRIPTGCLDRSIEHSERAAGGSPMGPVALFNVACAHSLRAQYVMEGFILSDGALMFGNSLSELREMLRDKLDEREPALPDSAAAEEGYALLRSAEAAHPVCDAIERHLRASVGALMKLYESGESVRAADGAAASLAWVVDSARRDADLAFLRSRLELKSSFGIQFEDFLRKMESRGDTVARWCGEKLGLVNDEG